MSLETQIHRAYGALLAEMHERLKTPFSLVLIVSVNDSPEGQMILAGPESASAATIANRLRVCADLQDKMAPAPETP